MKHDSPSERYFLDNGHAVSLTPSVALRRSQQGAIFAVGSHFTLHPTPAIVVMPTGAGKTVVLMTIPFVLGARRVLVLTPSRLVRNQIAALFRTLRDLRRIGLITGDVSDPKVHEVKERIKSTEEWYTLEPFNVVVAIPSSVSPAIAAIPQPPPDLFDLVLVDEAHHSPARTWNAVLAAFPEARRVLFTATPFRSDYREIDGRLVYSYPIAEAYKDGIFGAIECIPVVAAPATSNDVAIARAAEYEFQADRARGLDHCLMVRTDTRDRADELAETYRQHTGLRLDVIHSGHGYKHVLDTVEQLRTGALDGIICVNMLGEGFDFPQLKIAAIHAPHKSLAVTLQFIGRFARTGGERLGGAKFLAIPSDIEIQAARLYAESATWQELVPNLITTQIEREARTRTALQTFEPNEPRDNDFEDVSLYALRPHHHVKVYAVAGQVNLGVEVELPAPASIALRRVSEEQHSAVFIAHQRNTPRWTHLEVFAQTRYDLFVVYHDVATNLFFICASRKSESLYDEIVEQFCSDGAQRLPLRTINKALLGLTHTEFYNVGMRNRVLNNHTESYRIITGGNAHKAIRVSDGQLYHQGHLFGRANDSGTEVTIGLSSASKIWSSVSSQIPDLLDWCAQLAGRLVSERNVYTGSELDYLGVADVASVIPETVIAATWHDHTYRSPVDVAYLDSTGNRVIQPLLGLDLLVDAETSNTERIRLVLQSPDLAWPFDFWLMRTRHFAAADPKQPEVMIARARSDERLTDYLNAHPLSFYFADFSSLVGRDWMRADMSGILPFARERVEAIDWLAENADIRVEYGKCKDGRNTIHDVIARRLLNSECGLILYDHGPGEVADFLAITEDSSRVCFDFYHCKAGGKKGAKAGDRVEYLYEVCGQVVKARLWTHKHDWLVQHMRKRHRGNPEKFLRGDLEMLEHLIEHARGKRTEYRMVLVQPAISRARLSEKLGLLLAAADDYLARADCENLHVITSP